jgi:single-strand DNA-binding protein
MSLFDVNKAIIVGNITRDPELTYTPKGTGLLKFGVATNRSFRNEDGSYKDVPTYHNIVSWSKLAERVSKVAKKGSKVYIEGRIENRSYEKDGQTKFTSEVVADNIIVFERAANTGSGASASQSKPAEKSANQEPPASSGKQQYDEPIDPDDIPF